MRRGIASFPTTAGLPFPELAARAEALGYESLFVPEHSHLPLAETTFPNGAPTTWAHGACLDPFVALTAAACATSTLLLGTGVALLAQRDVFMTAKQVASLDVVSGAARSSASVPAGTAPRCATTGSTPSCAFL